MSAAEYRARQTVVALGLSVVGFGCAVWLLVKALAEITEGVRFPARGAR